MNADLFGAPLSAPTETVELIDRFIGGLVGYRADTADILSIADEYPQVAMVQFAAGALTMLSERRDAPVQARAYLERSLADSDANDREQALRQLLAAWIEFDVDRAAQIGDLIISNHPNDLLTLNLVQYFRFWQGDYPAMLRAALTCEEGATDRAGYWTMRAFALEQCHRIDEAEDAAETALAIQPDHPWGHHALAHVYLTRGTVDRGRRFLADVSPMWVGLNSFMSTHLWWHQALFEMATGGLHKVLDIYDEHCWGVDPNFSEDQIGAVSLLAQLECADIDVGDRWEALRPFLESRADDTLSPFRTLQYLYGLSRSGSRSATDLLASVRRQGIKPSVVGDGQRWKEIGIPAAEGLYAAAIGDHEVAVKRLSPVLPAMWKLGGSHAQRDLFTQIWLRSLIESGRWLDAQQVVDRRRSWIPEHPVFEAQADEIDRALGLC